jgi:HK97 gp10 family phage protein
VTVKVRVIGRETLKKRLAALQDEVTGSVKQAVLDGGNLIRDDIVESMRAPKSGRVYEVPGTTTPYTASAPGDAPAVATERLIRGIEAMPERDDLAVTVGVHELTNVEYAEHLEFGTRSMAARPWLFPALERNRARLKRRIDEAVRRALARAGRKG